MKKLSQKIFHKLVEEVITEAIEELDEFMAIGIGGAAGVSSGQITGSGARPIGVKPKTKKPQPEAIGQLKQIKKGKL